VSSPATRPGAQDEGATGPLATGPAETAFAKTLLALRVAEERNLHPEQALANALDVLVEDCAGKLPIEAFDALHGYTRRAAQGIWPGEIEERAG